MTADKQKIKKIKFSLSSKPMCIIIYAALLILCVCMCVLNTMTESYNIEVGGIAERTITAPYDVVDEYSTNLLKEATMQKVAPVYYLDDAQTEASKAQIKQVFASLETARMKAKQLYIQKVVHSESAFNAASVDWQSFLSETNMSELKAVLPEYISDENIYTLCSLTQEKLTSLSDSVYEYISEALSNGVKDEEKTDIASNIKSQIIRTGVFTNAQSELAYSAIINNISANMIYDAESTQTAKEAAAAAIANVEFKQGENIVQKGEKITQKQYELIKQLGLSSDENSMNMRWIIAAIMFFLLFAVGYFYLSVNDKQYINTPKDALNISLLVLLTAALAVIGKHLSVYIIPTFLAVIVGASFMMRRMTIAFGCFLSILTAFMVSPSSMFIFNETVLVNMLAGICGSTVAIMTLKTKQHRGEYILSGFFAGLVAGVVYSAYGITASLPAMEMLKITSTGVVSGLSCGLLSVGVLPIWEMMFSLSTPSKLLELANPGGTLLKRLMMEAPGTYHHSAVTANLAEAGCEAIGADALLARVAAYYHDIGKLYNPVMFKENQMGGENPHDKLTPEESAEILKNHVVFGGKLADKYKLPRKIKDIILQHHGTSQMGYFLYKAKEKGEVNEADFRYPGPRPQTVEAGVVMLADVVEAAVRANRATLKESEYGDFIKKMIKNKYEDGQLDMCPMNRRDLELVLRAFINVYEGANHDRIIYPEDNQ